MTRLLALLLDNGEVVRDPGWWCVADVMHSFHFYGGKVFGTIVDAETLVKVFPPDGAR